jgi:lipid A 4'-phosphatase
MPDRAPKRRYHAGGGLQAVSIDRNGRAATMSSTRNSEGAPDVFGLTRWFVGAFAACALLFVLLPQIDLRASSLFYSPSEGIFFLHRAPPVKFVYHAVPWIGRGVFALLVATLVVMFSTRKRLLLGLDRKACLYLLLGLLLGPVLLVNTILKDCWGRARPNQVEEFGGAETFTPAFVIYKPFNVSGSWPSGHAALGFFFVAFAPLLKKHRAVVTAAGVALGALIGLGRMAQGRHFLSDVIFAYFFVSLTARLLYYLLYESRLARSAFFAGLEARSSRAEG